MPARHYRVSLLAGACVALLSNPLAAQGPVAVLDTAIARMGGAPALKGITHARFEMMTMWQRTVLDDRVHADAPSFEWHSDLRDYTIGGWRNSRRFAAGATWREATDLVRDSVAIRKAPGGPGGVAAPTVAAGIWSPLNIAYIDERDEAFTFAPERLLLAAREASDLRALPDTTIASAPQARMSATVGRYPATITINRATGMLTMARFHALEDNDFGLVPFGDMEVEIWYSSWRRNQGGISYPYQWDELRVGRPYKRTSLLSAQFAAPAPPDSFVVSDSLRGAYLATQRHPMHDIPLDSAKLVDGVFASFNTPGAPAGAVKLGHSWVLLESGQAPLSAERAVAWLGRADPGSTVKAALVTLVAVGNGGSAWLAANGVAVHAGKGASQFVDAAIRGYKPLLHGKPSGVQVELRGRWIRVDGDSLWVEPIDLPDMPGTLIAWAPSHGWMYSAASASPMYRERMMVIAKARGWQVTRIGGVSAVAAKVN